MSPEGRGREPNREEGVREPSSFSSQVPARPSAPATLSPSLLSWAGARPGRTGVCPSMKGSGWWEPDSPAAQRIPEYYPLGTRSVLSFAQTPPAEGCPPVTRGHGGEQGLSELQDMSSLLGGTLTPSFQKPGWLSGFILAPHLLSLDFTCTETPGRPAPTPAAPSAQPARRVPTPRLNQSKPHPTSPQPVRGDPASQMG